MTDNHLEEPHVVAEGPQGLRLVLEEFLVKAEKDKEFAQTGHFILYQLGEQKSLIKVNLSKKPYIFWYNDLLGRPATRAVKKTIALFLMEKCGETAENVRELLGEDVRET